MGFQQLIAKIDEINQQDPNLEQLSGKAVAKAFIYSQRMLARLQDMQPNAPEVLKIAVYAQHINRWKIPRSEYPMGRQGYLQWRRALAGHHAQLTGSLMAETGYSEQDISRVAAIIKKQNLKGDPLAQSLEDVACLVFLEHYLDGMMSSHSEEKLISIIQKTWRKMSVLGQKFALKIDYTVTQRTLIEKALSALEPANGQH